MVPRYAVLGACLAFGVTVTSGSAARAEYVTVDLSKYVDTSFSNLASGAVYPVGTSVTGNTGLSFDIASYGGDNYWGGYPENGDAGTTLKITGLDIAGATAAYTLMNTWYGTVGDAPVTVTFVTSTNERKSFNLIEGTDIRDFTGSTTYTTSINGTTTQNWYSNGQTGTSALVLDQQSYDLSSLTGDIVEVDVSSNGSCLDGGTAQYKSGKWSCSNKQPGTLNSEETIFAGLSFLTSASSSTEVPEPVGLALLGSGLVALGAARRTRRN